MTNEFANITTQLTGIDESFTKQNKGKLMRCGSISSSVNSVCSIENNESIFMMKCNSESSLCESIMSDTDFVHVSLSSDAEDDYELESSFVFVERDSR